MNAIQIELPEPVHQRALQLAQQQSMSLDCLMVVALVEKLSTMFPDEALEPSQFGFRICAARPPWQPTAEMTCPALA